MKKHKLSGGMALDSVFLTATKLITSLISIIITKLLAVEFSLHDYGTYSQAMLIVSTATSLSILGLSDGVNFFYNGCEDKKQRCKNVNTVFAIQCIVGLVCAGVIVGFSGILTAYFDNPALKGIYIFIMFMPMLSNMLAMYQVLFVSIGKAKIIAIKNFIVSLAKLAAVALATLVTDSVVTIFAVTLITSAAEIAYFWIYFGKKAFFVNPIRFEKEKVVEILKYCLPLAAYILSNALCRDIDKHTISFFTDTETLAIYTNASKVLPFDMLTSSFATVMIPFITRYIATDSYEKSRNLYRNYLSFSYVTTWLVAFGAIVCADELMLILYDEKYIAGKSIFIIYIFIDMLRFANVAIILRAKGKTKELMGYSFGMLAANLVLNVILFKLLGIIGPAIANLTVTFAMNLIMLIQGAGIIKSKIYELIDFKDMSKTVVGMLLAGGVAVGIKHICGNYNLHYMITFILAYGSYAAIVFVLNIKKVLRLFKNMNKIKMEE